MRQGSGRIGATRCDSLPRLCVAGIPIVAVAEEPIDLAFLIQSAAVSTSGIRLATISDAGRSLRKRRATLYWDGRSFPDLSARLFQTMHAGLTVTMTVREVSRPSGTVDQYLVLDTRLPVLAQGRDYLSVAPLPD